MIVKMKRFTLLALNCDRERIYDSIVRCGCVQLKRSADIQSFTSADESQSREQLLGKIARVEENIAYAEEKASLYNASHKKEGKIVVAKNSIARPRTEIDYDYFLNFGQNAESIERSLSKADELKEELARLGALKQNKLAEVAKLAVYGELPHPTVWYHDTEHASVALGQIPASEVKNLHSLKEEYETVTVEQIGEGTENVAVVIVAHKSENSFFDKAVSLGFSRCNIATEVLPRVLLEDLERQINGIEQQIADINGELARFAEEIPQWKVYVDWLSLCEKKLRADGDVVQSVSTFVLEGFCPAEDEQLVRDALGKVSDNMVLCFYEIGDEEFAPTLTRNNKLTEPFEFVTNSYSVPDYHEIDPNPVMSVFYFIIFGLMVADIGYGLLLLVAGICAGTLIKQKTGIRTMLMLFGICGISAIAVGVLFGSVFSYTIWDKVFPDPAHPLHNGIIPDPSTYPMVMMIISLLFGVVHIIAGIGCNMAVKIKHKQHLSAWLVDFPWIIVFATFVLAIFNMALDMAGYGPYEALRLPPLVGQISLYVCIGALAVALVCAGLGTKGFLGKVIKSFGSAYGIINYFSDIMSYIRVFGIMLSSAIMGTVINTLAGMVASGGGVGYVFAAVVLVFAHMFNLVMGILSVYIHDGRLQYVEFFGKFYTGDGQLFVPFGSDTKYTLVK